jgi:hypothetical protein
MYVNGVPQTLAITGTGASNNGDFFGDGDSSGSHFYRIGAIWVAFVGNTDYEGYVDDLRIFDGALSAAEVKYLYLKGLANWEYSSWETLNASNQFQTEFTNGSTNFLPEFRLESDTYNFYTPFVNITN